MRADEDLGGEVAAAADESAGCWHQPAQDSASVPSPPLELQGPDQLLRVRLGIVPSGRAGRAVGQIEFRADKATPCGNRSQAAIPVRDRPPDSREDFIAGRSH